MLIKGIKEIKDVQRITVEPGQKSEVIQRGDDFLVVIAVQGGGRIRRVGSKREGNFVNYRTAVRLDFDDGKDFQLSVLDIKKEPLVAIVYRMAMTKYA